MKSFRHLRAGRIQGWFVGSLLVVSLLGGAGAWMAWRRFSQAGSPGAQPFAEPQTLAHLVAEGPPCFRDVTSQTGIDFTYRNGEEANQYTILEELGGGAALLDFDGDGLLDLFLTGGGYFEGQDPPRILGRPGRLYKNLGGWKFQDVTREVGLHASAFYSHGTAVADYDRDGWPDLLVTGYGQLALFHNEQREDGCRRFVNVAEELGLSDHSWSTSAGWGDLNGDGFPDLYVCHYVDWSFDNHPVCPGFVPGVKRDNCPPTAFRPLVHALFLNEEPSPTLRVGGGRRFRNVSVEQGFAAKGCGLGVLVVDVNDDARPDLYVANDTNHNFLLFNRDGRLEELGVPAGVAADESGTPNGSMGVDAGDYDSSGRPSLWVTNFQRETHGLYRNYGRETFLHQSRAAGIAAIGQHFVGFGTGFLDFDNDGWEDLAIANGHVFRHVANDNQKQRPALLRNTELEGRRFFQDHSPHAGEFFQTPAIARGLAVGDLDNDGWADLVICQTNTPAAVLRNVGGEKARPNRWLGIRLAGCERRDVVGSTVVVETGARKLTRFAKGGGSYLSAGDSRLLFGLGDAEKVRKVTVKWSWGQTQTWEDLESNRYWTLGEGAPQARSLRSSTSPTRPLQFQASRY